MSTPAPRRRAPPARRRARRATSSATCTALFGREPSGALIEVRYRHGDGMRRDFLAHTDTFAAARTILRLGPAQRRLRRRRATPPPRRRQGRHRPHLDAVGRPRHPDRTRPARQRLPVAPAILIASGTAGHLHAYWPLHQPISITAGRSREPPARRAARRRQRRGHERRDDPRPPGTYSFKTTPPTPVLRAAPRPGSSRHCRRRQTRSPTTHGRRHPARRSRDPRAAAGSDPLRALDPAHYVSVLTGQTVGRSRKISCPLHEDRTPSFHVYEHPEDGWYCFGCRRHGHTVYDLASLLWFSGQSAGEPLRGARFLEVRRRLMAMFFPEGGGR